MLHSTEDTLAAYREVALYTIKAVEDNVEDLKKSLQVIEDPEAVRLIDHKLEVLENALYIIYNDD